MKTYPSTVLDDSPVWYARLDEASGTTVYDSSGFDRHGSHVITPITLGADPLLVGEDATSTDFQPASGAPGVTVATADWMPNSTWTIEAVFKLSSAPGLKVIFARGTPDAGLGNVQWMLRIDGVTLKLYRWSEGTWDTLTGPEVTVGTVYHIAVTCESNVVTMYLNGLVVATRTAVVSAGSGGPFRVGFGVAGEYFKGLLSDVACYSTALSSTRIREHTKASITYHPKPAPNLRVSEIGSSTARVSWDASEVGAGGVVDGYTLKVGAEAEIELEGLTHEQTGLVAGATYLATVRAWTLVEEPAIAASVSSATASSWYYSEPPGNAFDSNASTHWTTNGPDDAWLQATLTEASKIVTYSIRRRDDIPSRNPAAWTFESSADEITWEVLDSRSGITWPTPGQTQIFTCTAPNDAVLYYRIHPTLTAAGVGGSYLSITEFQMFPRGDLLKGYSDPSTLSFTTRSEEGISDEVAWWDGTDKRSASLLGWWDGSEIQHVDLLGYWDGSAVVTE